MKNKSIHILFFLLLFSKFIDAQELFHDKYNWEKEYTVPNEVKEDKVILYENEVIEFAYDNQSLNEFYNHHVVEYIASESAAEDNFKKYIVFSGSSEVVDAKAKVIKPDGNELFLDKSKILASKNEETGRSFKYFALEGLSKGDIINFYYVIKKYPNYNGIYYNIQGSNPIKDYNFQLLSPKNLIFGFKVLNDTSTMQLDTLVKDKNCWKLHFDSVPPLIDEENAPYNILLKKILYKLNENLYTRKKDITAYGYASQNLYYLMYTSADKKDKKAINNIIKKMALPKSPSFEEKILHIENYLKLNYQISEMKAPGMSKPEVIYKNKVASSTGITKLFVNVLKKLNIDHQLVVTSDRDNSIFDKEFESYHFLDQYLIYFPEEDKFLIPDNIAYRYGMIPAAYTENYGLFIRKTKVGDFVTGLGEVKYIPGSSYKQNHMNHNVTAVIRDDLSGVDLEIEKSMQGHFAGILQAFLSTLNDDILLRTAKEMMSHYNSDGEITDWSFENKDPKYSSLKPLIFKAKTTNTDFIEMAGDKYLFKLGELIEPQSELYSKEERKLPVYDRYKREFSRKLIIELPDGYKISNPDDISIHVDSKIEDKTVLLFHSEYKMEGKKLIVTIEEYYDKIYHTVEEYEQYKAVVNSASDFNKVTLVIEKN